MSKNRLIFQNWIVDLGGEPGNIKNPEFVSIEDLPVIWQNDKNSFESSKNAEQQRIIENAVNDALKKLSENEREFIIRYYYMGENYNQISEKTNREIYKLAAMHKRAVIKLKTALKAFVMKNYGIKSAQNKECIICCSEHKDQINELIKKRDRRRTWSPIIKQLKKEFGIIIKTPQILIGHEKYHI